LIKVDIFRFNDIFSVYRLETHNYARVSLTVLSSNKISDKQLQHTPILKTIYLKTISFIHLNKEAYEYHPSQSDTSYQTCLQRSVILYLYELNVKYLEKSTRTTT